MSQKKGKTEAPHPPAKDIGKVKEHRSVDYAENERGLTTIRNTLPPPPPPAPKKK